MMEDGAREKDDENETMAEMIDSRADVPDVGMVFKEESEIRRICKDYAYREGFAIKKVSSKIHVAGRMKFFVLACSRDGILVSTSKRSFESRTTSRTGCKARINVIVKGEGQCSISSVCLEHNHTLNPSKVRFRRCRRKLNSCSMMRLESEEALVVGSGRFENVSLVERDFRNYIAIGRQLRLGVGDAEAPCKYFVRMQRRDSSFFYLVDMDEDGRLRNVFWADARSRGAYEAFGDVVSFDTTYLTSNYD